MDKGEATKTGGFLAYHQPWIDEDDISEVVDSLRSGWITHGPKVERFEEMIAGYTGARHALCVNSATAALHLSLLALGVGNGDEVITTPFSFAATANVIVHVGATPRFVDIGRDTYNIDAEKIEEAINSKTRAIMPVHYAGQPCDMEPIEEIARLHNLPIIEDAAHALGAQYRGRRIGAIGDLTCFSFYATKNITTGEGGAVTTGSDALSDRVKRLRLHGMSRDAWKRYSRSGSWYYEIEDCGWKYNMDDIQASLGIQQLRKLDRFTEVRRRYAQVYNGELSKLEQVIIPYESPDVYHPYHLYPILLQGFDRNAFIEEMGKRGIGCSVHFIPIHLHPFYARRFGFKRGDFPNAEWVYDREVSLPLYPKMTEDDLYRVIAAVKEILQVKPAVKSVGMGR